MQNELKKGDFLANFEIVYMVRYCNLEVKSKVLGSSHYCLNPSSFLAAVWTSYLDLLSSCPFIQKIDIKSASIIRLFSNQMKQGKSRAEYGA